MVTSNDDHGQHNADAARLGSVSTRYHHTLKGFNYRMDGHARRDSARQARHLEAWTATDGSTRPLYTRAACAVDAGHAPVEPPAIAAMCIISTLCDPPRSGPLAAEARWQTGFRAGIHYPIPVHLQPAYADLGYRPGRFPVTEGRRASAVAPAVPRDERRMSSMSSPRSTGNVWQLTRPSAETGGCLDM